MTATDRVGLGGSCHWCTEAIFLSLRGVVKVEQGWLASVNDDDWFSEGIIVTFEPAIISLADLIAVHLHTHSCTANHSMRQKYRSAVYVYSEPQHQEAQQSIESLQDDFEQKIITRVLSYSAFKLNGEQYQNYYYDNPEKPFCENIINPKLRILMQKFSDKVDNQKLPQQLSD